MAAVVLIVVEAAVEAVAVHALVITAIQHAAQTVMQHVAAHVKQDALDVREIAMALVKQTVKMLVQQRVQAQVMLVPGHADMLAQDVAENLRFLVIIIAKTLAEVVAASHAEEAVQADVIAVVGALQPVQMNVVMDATAVVVMGVPEDAEADVALHAEGNHVVAGVAVIALNYAQINAKIHAEQLALTIVEIVVLIYVMILAIQQLPHQAQ